MVASVLGLVCELRCRKFPAGKVGFKERCSSFMSCEYRGWFEPDPFLVEGPATAESCRRRQAAWRGQCGMCGPETRQGVSCSQPELRLRRSPHTTSLTRRSRGGSTEWQPAMQSSSTSPLLPLPPPSPSRPPPLQHAIVIKGPLRSVTRDVLRLYLEREDTAAVVFSHSRGACYTEEALAFLRQLAKRHRSRFAYTIRPALPHQGLGFRNTQREACYYGVRLAITRWRVKYVLVHRADSGFVAGTDPIMPRLEQILQAQPPPVAAASGITPPGLRIGFGPVHHLGSWFGQYHLDDHLMYGRAEDVLRFWSVDAPGYCRTCRYSTALLPEVRDQRRLCLVPGPEAENGILWVRSLRRATGGEWPEPPSTLTLLRERAFVLNPTLLGYVQRLNASELPELPLPPSHALVHETSNQLFGHFTRSAAASAWSLLKAFKATARYLHNFSTLNLSAAVDPVVLGDGRRRAAEPVQREWVCYEPEDPMMIRKWNASCRGG